MSAPQNDNTQRIEIPKELFDAINEQRKVKVWDGNGRQKRYVCADSTMGKVIPLLWSVLVSLFIAFAWFGNKARNIEHGIIAMQIQLGGAMLESHAREVHEFEIENPDKKISLSEWDAMKSRAHAKLAHPTGLNL